MLSGIYSAASALRTAEIRQDVIATNLAHMNVPGFRRSGSTVTSFAEELLAQEGLNPGHGQNLDTIYNEFTPGSMETTRRRLDVAIDGDGFFAVEGPDETLYTRKGVFHIGPNGELTGAGGYPLLGESGALSVPSDVSESQITIGMDGSVNAGGNNIGKLKLVRFQDNSRLQQVGTTLFSAAQATEGPGDDVIVRQGVREHSNVSPVTEMIDMVLNMRYYEASERILKSIGEAVQQQTHSEG